eukprot:scaffold33787_cov71-Phaeocystis_antarctica.AAC.4
MARRSTYRSASSETRSCAAAQPLSTASPCDGGKGRHSSRVTLDCQSHCTGLLSGAAEPPAGVGVTGCFVAAGGCAAGGAAAASSDGGGGGASVAGAGGAASVAGAGGAASVAGAGGAASVAGAEGAASVAGAGGRGTASLAAAAGAASLASGSRVKTASTDECCFRSRQICAEWPTVASCPFLSQRHGAEAPRRTPVGLAPWLTTTTLLRSVTVTVA